jgi:hypothetical protein
MSKAPPGGGAMGREPLSNHLCFSLAALLGAAGTACFSGGGTRQPSQRALALVSDLSSLRQRQAGGVVPAPLCGGCGLGRPKPALPASQSSGWRARQPGAALVPADRDVRQRAAQADEQGGAGGPESVAYGARGRRPAEQAGAARLLVRALHRARVAGLGALWGCVWGWLPV